MKVEQAIEIVWNMANNKKNKTETEQEAVNVIHDFIVNVVLGG